MRTNRRPISPTAILRAGILAGVFALLPPATAHATAQAAAKIPPNDFGCTLCHAGTGATVEEVPAASASILTPFGEAWVRLAIAETDRLWADMAVGNADGDGCSNGCELDDPRGVFLPDEPFDPEVCAPGDPSVSDCALPINERSWSTLKSLFGDNR